jgi:predicted dinucleotide-binding enzyme
MKIGIVGSGKIGGLLGTLWSKAGHDVLFSSRPPETLVAHAGDGATLGTPEEAIAFSDVVLLSIPFVGLPAFGRKIVLDTSNAFPSPDGPMAEEVRQSGPYLRKWFPGLRIVRAFNSVLDRTLASEAHRAGAQVGIPLASDDDEALQVAAKLVTDAGFDPLIVGPLDRSREFDFGAAVYDTGMSGTDVRATLGLPAA